MSSAMASHAQNERKFKQWEELPGGGRRYFRDYVGRVGGRARYIKVSKKLMQTKQRLGLLGKFTTSLAVLWPCTRNFPSI
jgi:hypothetical protein